MKIIVFGSGQMAQVIAAVMSGDDRFETLWVSSNPDGAGHCDTPVAVDRRFGATSADLANLMTDADAIIMAGGAWSGAADIAAMARNAGCHYLDVTENPASMAAVAQIAAGAQQGFAPGCGLAPGYVTALVADHLRGLGPEGRITAHVGVLPAVRANRLGYGNILGVDGLLVEYTQPCRAIRGGQSVTLPPLDDLERVEVEGETFESFTTAGSLDALVADFTGRVDGLVFKTLRYPGHLDYIRLLMDDLGLAHNQRLLRSLLLNGLQRVDADRVLIVLDVLRGPGLPLLRLEQTIAARRDARGQWCSAGLSATAAHVCAMADLLCHEGLDRSGLVAPGIVPLAVLRRSPFFAPLHAEAMLPKPEV
jgi:saccharopine dehydrogenase-like NADP-dependent oxidoreductase